jgi:NAD-dependent oxidoreductase involved in siderophore biosynthesis
MPNSRKLRQVAGVIRKSLNLLTHLQSIALREAIREYEANKWKVIGQKVGKPAKVHISLPSIYDRSG